MFARISVAALALLCTACAGERAYQLGVQNDPTHAVFAELIAAPLRAAGARVVPVPCGDLRACAQALNSGEIHLMPAYTGDAAALALGARIRADRPAVAHHAFLELGFMITPELGFDAPFLVAVRAERAAQEGLRTLEDLGTLANVRIAVAPGYAERPRDGLGALVRRHGIDLAPSGHRVIAELPLRLAAVLDGTADAVVLRDFGYDLRAAGLARLEDSLGFFPGYEALVVAGPAMAPDIAWLQETLSPLVGRLGDEAIAGLMEEVMINGWPAQAAVEQMLVERGLPLRERFQVTRPPMIVAYAPQDELDVSRKLAVFAINRAFPGRVVELLAEDDPFAAIESGRATLALADAARFFVPRSGHAFAEYDERAEAVVSLGERFLYLLRDPSGARSARRDPLAGDVGVALPGGTGEAVGTAILAALDRTPALRAGRADLIAALGSGAIDSALILAGPEPSDISDAIERGALTIESLTPWIAEAPLFLNEARLPARLLPGRTIETLSMQLLLAGPVPPARHALRGGGPASALKLQGEPVSLDEAEALARASGVSEPPDPLLRTVWERAPRDGGAAQLRADIMDTAMNLAVLTFIGWCLLLLIRRDRGDTTVGPGSTS